MTAFKVDDKVKIVQDFETWLGEGMTKDTVLTVIDKHDVPLESWVNPETDEIEIDALKSYPEDFTKVEDTYFSGGLLEQQAEELGVYRPNLQDRKVGKVGMHFVVDGFPNALREIAKVMDWAADVKGYKLHDWKNLPKADIALPSAAYRHSNDNSVQKAQGLSALDRTDHESKLLHKAHEAFNTLAELELIITGVIK